MRVSKRKKNRSRTGSFVVSWLREQRFANEFRNYEGRHRSAFEITPNSRGQDHASNQNRRPATSRTLASTRRVRAAYTCKYTGRMNISHKECISRSCVRTLVRFRIIQARASRLERKKNTKANRSLRASLEFMRERRVGTGWGIG